MNANQRRTPVVVDAALRDRFVALLRDTGAVGVAADRLGVSRFAMSRARRGNPDFATACDVALGRKPAPVNDAAKLEAALLERLRYGVKRKQYFAGKVVGTYRVFNDRLAYAVLAKLMPEKYGPGATTAAAPLEVMSREAFLAIIAARPRTADLPASDAD